MHGVKVGIGAEGQWDARNARFDIAWVRGLQTRIGSQTFVGTESSSAFWSSLLSSLLAGMAGIFPPRLIDAAPCFLQLVATKLCTANRLQPIHV